MTPTLPDRIATTLADLCRRYLRAPDNFATDAETGLPVLAFTPALSPAEQLDYADLLAMARSYIVGLTLAEYQAVKPSIETLRTFRQQTQAEFMALTAAQRDRVLFDVANAQTNVLRALLRD